MQSETAERTREFHRLGVQDSRRGLAGVGYKEFKPSYQSPQRQLKPGDIGEAPLQQSQGKGYWE